MFHCVFGIRYDRMGATFLQDVSISIGYKEWVIISAFNTDFIEEDFVHLEQMKKRLFKFIEYYKDDKESIKIIGESIWNLQKASLEAKTEEARKKFQDMNVYLGLNGKSHEKRAAGALIAGAIGLGSKIATIIWDWHVSNQNNKKLNEFLAQYNATMGSLEADVEELVSNTDLQVSFNRNVLNRILKLEESFQTLNVEINKLQDNVNTKLKLQYQYQYLVKAFQEMIDFQNSVINGLVAASKGKAQPPFLSPNKVLNVLQTYQNSETTEKSYFNREDILYIYNMVEARIERVGNEVAVLNTIKLPTINTKAKLFRIISYPVYNSTSEKFVHVKVNYPYIAVNSNSQYLLLTHADINSCEKSQEMILCESNDKMFWTDRDVPSCEASIWFGDQELMEELCDFDVENHDDQARITFVENGLFHYSLGEKLSVPIECTGSGTQTSQNLHLEKNGFILIPPSCKANVQGNLLINYMNEDVDVETYDIIPDVSTFDIENIWQHKYEALEEIVEEARKHDSLNNDEILESILDEHESHKQTESISDLFESYKKTAKTAEESRKNQIMRTKNAFASLQENGGKETGKETLNTIIIGLAAIVSLIFIGASIFLFWILTIYRQ